MRADQSLADVRFSVTPVYTGSAADYDKPSLVHVGTGEGSQVYGWGLYGSGVRKVAEGYANRYKYRHTDGRELTSNMMIIYGKMKVGGELTESGWTRIGAPHLYSQTFFTNRAPGDESHLLSWYEPVSKENIQRILDQVKKENLGYPDRQGYVFGAWDLQGLVDDYDKIEYPPKGDSVYKEIARDLGSPKAASEFLARADIDGIKYPVDSFGGKGVKDGDKAGWNYVSFRDDNIRVDHKWVDGKKRFSVTVRKAMNDLAETGTGIIHRHDLGDIHYNLGRLGKRGMGLAHIVESRMRKDGDTLAGAIDIAISVAEAAESGVITKERYNTKHFDLNGIRAIVAFTDDGNKVITGYEISADIADGANRRSSATQSQPHVSLEEIVSALKSRLASLPPATARSIPYPAAPAQGVRGEAPSVAQPRASVRAAWRPDFPRAVAQTTRANIMAKYADLFNRAKAGDSAAAADLIEKVVKPEKVRELVKGHDKATIVMPIHAEEATGDNKLPIAYAKYIANTTGLAYDDGIVQSVRAFHTGSKAEYRLFVQPEFDGPVRRGAEYIIVDDHITQGGTVNALRDHIESNGGKVVAIAALTLSQGSSILSPQKDTIDEVKRKWPDINRLLRAAGIADRVEALTESQCRYIQKFSADTFRARCLASGREGGVGVLRQTLGTPSEGVAREETEAERARMRHSVFVGNRAILRRVVDLSTRGQARSILDNRHNGHYTSEARDEIYLKTGWWLGTDGKWRFELSDLKPKKRGKTVGDHCVNGLYHYADSMIDWCPLSDMVSHAKLFKAYPELRNVDVDIADPDDMTCPAFYDPNRNHITINWDLVEWYSDDENDSGLPTNVLTDEGLATITHEVQHIVQSIEGFASGGSVKEVGLRNYWRLAGEVEARNAARRIGYGEGGRAPAGGYEAWRARQLNSNDAPWQTEDVRQSRQIIADEDGHMTDIHGRRVPRSRHSVRRASNAASPRDLATALVASRRLAGKDMTPEDVERIVRNLGLTDAAPDVLARANALADANREKLRSLVDRRDPDLVATLARQGLADRLATSLDDLITGTASAADPDVGARVQRAIQSKQTRDLMNAHGFDAARP